jgi:hypothetical protein
MSNENPKSTILLELESIVTQMGEWRKFIVLGGGVALIVYDAYLAKTDAKPVGTNDIDWLIDRKPMVSHVGSESISKILEDQGYVFRTKNTGNPPITSYVKEVGEQEIEVEFLTHNQVRAKADVVEIPIAKVTAQTLSYLEMSIRTVVIATLPNDVEFNVVAPEAWVFQKGSSKEYKDLYGIWFVLSQLSELSISTKELLKRVQAANPNSWKKDFDSNLQQWVSDASPNDWQKLVSQDPHRRLTEIGFKALVTEIIGG